MRTETGGTVDGPAEDVGSVGSGLEEEGDGTGWGEEETEVDVSTTGDTEAGCSVKNSWPVEPAPVSNSEV